MSKVKLIVKEFRALDNGHVVETEVRVPEHQQVIGIIRTDFDPAEDGTTRASDDLAPVIPYERINDLVGKLLTQVEASIVDDTQRQAMKDLFKQIAWDWYTSQSKELHEPWRESRPKEK